MGGAENGTAGKPPSHNQTYRHNPHGTKPWPVLFKDFSTESTFHGLNKVMESSHFFRRVFWLMCILAAMVVLIYVIVKQLINLSDHPVVANLEVIYNDSLAFPSVTVCNQNMFRKTVAHQNGMYSYISNAFTEEGVIINSELEGFTKEANRSMHYREGQYYKYASITPEVCRATCEELRSDSCCTLIYIRDKNTCYITAVEAGVSNAEIINTPGVDLYHRDKCSVQNNFWTDFESDLGASDLAIEKKYGVEWSVTEARGDQTSTKWVPSYDNTTRSANGHFLLVSVTDAVYEQLAFYTPYLSTQSPTACLHFAYLINSGELHVDYGLDDSYQRLWSMTFQNSHYWEYAQVSLPPQYSRIKFEAQVHSSSGGIEIAVDDIRVYEDCSDMTLSCRRSVTGIGFRGNTSISSFGNPCVNWSTFDTWDTWVFPEQEDGALDTNACRNPDGNANGPWCVTDVFKGRMEYCDIPACPCELRGGSFRCQNGECLSRSLVCDRVVDCHDGSDEFDCGSTSYFCEFGASNCNHPDNYLDSADWRFQIGYMLFGKNKELTPYLVEILFSPSFKSTSTKHCLNIVMSPNGVTPFSPVTIEIAVALATNAIYSQTLSVFVVIQPNFDCYFDIDVAEFIDYIEQYYFQQRTSIDLMYKIAFIHGDPAHRIPLQIINTAQTPCSELEIKEPLRCHNAANTAATLSRSTSSTDMLSGWTTLSDIPTSQDSSLFTDEDTITPSDITSSVSDDPSESNDTMATDAFVSRHALGSGAQPMSDSGDISEVIWLDASQCQACPRPIELRDAMNDSQSQCTESMVCSFTECGCGYRFVSSNIFNTWELSHNTSRDDDEDSERDHYAAFQKYARDDDWTKLLSPVTRVKRSSCLSLYYMGNFNNFRVSLVDGDSEQFLFTISFDGQQNTWHAARTEVPPGTYSLLILLEFVSNRTHDVGIDDVSIVDGPCVDENAGSITCNFTDPFLCQYYDISHKHQYWFRSKEAGAFEEYYLRTNRKGITKIPRQILSPYANISTDHCLRFEYFGQGAHNDTFSELSVTRLDINGPELFKAMALAESAEHAAWGILAVVDNNWHVGEVAMAPGSFRLLFELNGDDMRGGIRRIDLAPGECTFKEECLSQYRCAAPDLGLLACIAASYQCDGIQNCINGLDEGDQAGCNQLPADPEAPQKHFIGQLSYREFIADLQPIPTTSYNLTSFYATFGHQLDDMIYKCSWLGVPCDPGVFTPTVTDYGQCYTFNADGKLQTDLTGASTGLSLTLNIENYQYMSSPHVDAGLKVFLHEAYEVPEVRDLGFAVPPGAHTLVGVQLYEATSIPHPWSKCGEKDLKYFEQYSYSACKLEYKVDAMYNTCLCRDAYMPATEHGFPPMCDVERYFTCVVPETYYTHYNSTLGSQSCPKPCEQGVYEASLSNSLLSSLSTTSILSDNTTNLQNTVTEAARTHHRVSPSIFYHDLSTFENLSIAYDNLYGNTFTYIGDEGCSGRSIFCQIAEACDTAVGLFFDDMTTIFRGNEQRLDLYNDNFQAYVDYLKDALTEVQYRFQDYMTVRQFVTDTKLLDPLYSEFVGRVALVRANILYMLDNYHFEVLLSPEQLVFFPNQVIGSKRCMEDIIPDANSFFQNLVDEVDATIKNMTSTNPLVRISNHIRAQRLAILACAQDYRRSLQAIKDFEHDADATIKASLKAIKDLVASDVTQEEYFKVIKGEYGDIISFTNGYAFDNLSIANLDQRLADAKTHAELFQDTLQRTFIQPFSDELNNLQDAIISNYKQSMRALLDLAPYFGDAYIYNVVAIMEIWRIPSPNLLNPKRYLDTGREIWIIWEEGTSFENFVHTKADDHIVEGVSNYFAPLLRQVDTFGDLMVANTNNLELQLTLTQRILSEYNDEKAVDRKFVQRNFLSLDIFYEQLKYQKTSQVKAYTGTNFITDLGGIIGLLIGGSVLSIVELLDFCMYNGILKAIESHRSKNPPRSNRRQSFDIETANPPPNHQPDTDLNQRFTYSQPVYVVGKEDTEHEISRL